MADDDALCAVRMDVISRVFARSDPRNESSFAEFFRAGLVPSISLQFSRVDDSIGGGRNSPVFLRRRSPENQETMGAGSSAGRAVVDRHCLLAGGSASFHLFSILNWNAYRRSPNHPGAN